jgi:hypothetical protein
MNKVINDPEVLAELESAFNEYEKAFVANDIATLDRLFWNSPHTLRYGAAENLYGYDEIKAFRSGRPSNNLARTILRKSLVTIGNDFGVANMEFSRTTTNRIGRQSQTWVRFPDGWKVVSAHVSLMDAAT